MSAVCLVTGASGLLGRAMMRAFNSNSSTTKWTVIGTGFSRATKPLIKLDICDEKAVKAVLEEHHPDVIIHCAAERRPDVVHNRLEDTKALNIGASRMLACAVTELNNRSEASNNRVNKDNDKDKMKTGKCMLVYISTDYVFDGTSPPYLTDSVTNPLNDYGVTKRDGETACLEACDSAVVLRIPILYGQVASLEESAVTVLAKKLMQAMEDHEKCTFDAAATRYPTDTDDIASVVVRMADARDRCIRAETGRIYHFESAVPFTKYAMALDMCGVICANSPERKAELIALMDKTTLSTAVVRRPHDCALDCSLIVKVLGRDVVADCVSFKQGIASALKPYLS